jgi:hypothetical protein
MVGLVEMERVLKKIRLLMDDLENMICQAEPETKESLLYIYSEVEDIYNILRRWDK